MSDLDPIVGNWYKNVEEEKEFEVVAVDEDAQTVEIQYFEGEVEEIDLDSWYELVLEPIEAPEDWSVLTIKWSLTIWAMTRPAMRKKRTH